MNDAIRTQLSAFVDGELSEAEAGLLIRRLSRDPQLRALVAEYQSVGRVMRAEEPVAGAEQLLGRIHRELGAAPDAASEPAVVAAAATRSFRPMVGVAAAVAVLAVFGVSQFAGVEEVTTAESYTVPEAADEIYFERHSQTASSLSTRVVTYQLQSENLDEEDVNDDELDNGNSEEMPAAE